MEDNSDQSEKGTERVPISCGWCGAELESLHENHVCAEGVDVMRAVQERDASHIVGFDDE